jgi:flavorubredoxin
MDARPVVENVQWGGAIDWDRRLFDALISLPDGTGHSTYLVRGSQKTALVDSVDPTRLDKLPSRLASTGAARIDRVIFPLPPAMLAVDRWRRVC